MTDDYKYRIPEVPCEVDWIPFDSQSAFMIFRSGGPMVDQQGHVLYLATLPTDIWMGISQTELPPGAHPEPTPIKQAPAKPSFMSAAKAAWQAAQLQVATA